MRARGQTAQLIVSLGLATPHSVPRLALRAALNHGEAKASTSHQNPVASSSRWALSGSDATARRKHLNAGIQPSGFLFP